MKNEKKELIQWWFIWGCWRELFCKAGRLSAFTFIVVSSVVLGWLEYFWPEIRAIIENDEEDW